MGMIKEDQKGFSPAGTAPGNYSYSYNIVEVLKMLKSEDKPEEPESFQEREYQSYLVRLAKQRNIIVCLPTGSGKTFIGLQLAKDYLPEAKRQGRKIIFLANTVPLVNQQAEYFRDRLTNTFLNEASHHVECLTGDRNVDVWKNDKWDEVLRKFDVLVMTTQIFVDALNHGYISYEKVKLLILDECHHTAKDSPMNQVMLRYREEVQRSGGIPNFDLVPRVLGLTATIIMGKKNQVESEVMEAEKRLCARAVTYHKYEDVLRHSTSAKVEFVLYEKSAPTVWDQFRDHFFRSLERTLGMVLNTNEKLTTDDAPEIDHHSFRTDAQRFNNKEAAHLFLRGVVKEVLDVCADLGLYCAKIVAVHKRAFLHTIMHNKDNNVVESLIKSVDSALELFIVRAERVMGAKADFDQLMLFRTDKVGKILEILTEYKSGDELRGLIFAERRITTQALCWYLQELSSVPASAFKFLRVGFIVGTATFGLDPIATRITVNEQKTVINKFRTGEYNLLIATRVLEEGLDVPACNLVVRIDKIQTYPSYVQSMGRARHKNSRFLGFIDKADEAKEKRTYEEFEKYNLQLSEHLRKNALHADDEFDEAEITFSSPQEQAVPDFEPFPGRAPRISAIEAISITQRYCQLLSCDKFVVLAPVYWWEEVGSGKTRYKAYVQFPTNSVIREIVEGEPQETKMLAKRSAALEACKKLYERGQLNDKLFPVSRVVTPEINSFMAETLPTEQEVEKEGEPKVGTKKRTQWYYRKVADCLKNTKILTGTQLKAYVIRFDLLNRREGLGADIQSLYEFRRRKFIFCLLTPVDLSEIPEFLLYVNPIVGSLKVTLEEVPLRDHTNSIAFNEKQLELLRRFHRYIFADLLQLRRPLMKDCYSSVLIAPLRKDGQENLETFGIDWKLIDDTIKIPEDFFKPPPDEERKNFQFVESNYEDAVVMPWYRAEKLFYTVLEVWEGTSPLTKFEVNAQYPNYETYFLQKYPNVVKFIANKEQNLLRVKSISQNLNFFRSGVNYKKSQAERKDGRDNIIEMIPELTLLYPLPGSLFIQAKFLPTFLQRINRYLCARDIIIHIAKGSPWSGVNFGRKDCAEEIAYLSKCDPADVGIIPCRKAIVEDRMREFRVMREPMNKLTLNVVDGNEDSKRRDDQKEPSMENAVPSTADEYVLDFIHPRELTYHHLNRIRSRVDRFREVKIKNLQNGDNPFLDTREWTHEKETKIDLTPITAIEFNESLDRTFEFEPKEQPSMYSIMQAITMEGSLDSVNLERQEMIGDSFLKYCVSRHIFSYFPNAEEGVMTQWRSQLISNRCLYLHGKKLCLGEYLAGGLYRPECAWLPPGFEIPQKLVEALMKNQVNDDVFHDADLNFEEMSPSELNNFVAEKKTTKYSIMPDNQGYAHARVPDKSVADSVEALIGAYYVSGGVGAALHVMKKIGLRGPSGSCNGGTSVPFGDWPLSVTPDYNPGNDDDVRDHIPLFEELENLIEYKFHNKWLIVEAFSHPCYVRNRVTNCYQRLEFLGDAVLDFLVTNHIYKANTSLNPGELTDLRAALVNNVTFGSLAVRYRLDTYLLHNQKSLQDAINVFVECQKSNGHEVTGHFKLLSDIDCYMVSDVDCPKVLGDIFESLAGAVFLDSGMSLDTTWKVFYRLMQHEIDKFSKDVPKSPVRILYEAYPNTKIFYDITDSVLEHHPNRAPGLSYVALNLKFKRADGELPVVGIGKNKQSAKLAAAKYYNKIMGRNFV